MEAAPPPPPPQPPAPAFPSMRGMAPAPAPVPEQHFAAMRGMATTPAPQPPETYAAMRGMASAAALQPRPAAPAMTTLGPNGKNPTTATVLSVVFPGGGQFYNADMKKGLAVLAIAIVAALLTLNGAYILGMPLSLANWVWAILDAGKVARGQKAIW